MGTSSSRPNERFGCDTLSYIFTANRPELLAMEKRFRQLIDDQGKPADYKLSRENFDQACRDCSIKPSDRDILLRFFVLSDKSGLDEVHYKDLLVGITPIIKGSLEDKVRLALRLCDEEDAEILTRDEVEHTLAIMNRTLGFLGDPKLSDDRLEEIIDSIFDTVKLEDGHLRYNDHVSLIAYHPVVETLLRK